MLSPKRQLFVKEYLVDLNATQAAIRAGYSARSAKVTASRLLSDANVAAALDAGRKARESRADKRGDAVIRALEHLAYFDPAEFLNLDGTFKDIHAVPVEVRKAIAGMDVLEEFDGQGKDRTMIGWTMKQKYADRIRALELLGKHHKLFTDVHEHSGKDGGPIETESATDLTKLNAEQLRQLAGLLESAKAVQTSAPKG